LEKALANLNRIILVGRLTADPEVRSTLDGLPMAKFRLAVNRQAGGGRDNGTDFIDVVAWRRLAEVCGDYLKKGRLVLVEGRIQIRTFEDQTGQRRWATEVVARNMQMLDRTSTPGRQPEARDAGPEAGEEFVDDSDLAGDLPF
jgi:single-strand DNA-binding protein